MAWFRQIVSFSFVGILATLTHVTLAWSLMQLSAVNPYFANFLGACAAFVISFSGNARLTFRTTRSMKSAATRYVGVTGFSLMTTSVILTFVRVNALPEYAYILIVLAIVPASTFLIAKYWAFKNEHAENSAH